MTPPLRPSPSRGGDGGEVKKHYYKVNKEFLYFDPKELSIPKRAGLIQGAVAPRPIALASTIDKEGRPNLSPFSFFNVFGMNPPVLIFSPSRRGKDNTTKHTYENVMEVPEVVINVVTYEIVQKVSDSSADFPKGVNEFEMVGLTMLKSDLVKPFRVQESPVQFECRVIQVIQTGEEPAAGNLVICEILRMHISQEILDESGRIDPHKIDLVGRLGRDFYVRASGDAIFEVKKPE
jgi:flavin reductase (DIM6/NTAB) family NADH-FMN oxidoreductase RutF